MLKWFPEEKFYVLFKNDVDYLPFGYGRARPINFEDEYLYAQHWTKEELQRFLNDELNYNGNKDNKSKFSSLK